MEKKPTSKGKVSKEFEFFMKIVLVGNSAVGKSSLMLRFCDNIFKDTYVNTIGVDFRFKTLQIDGNRVKIQVWDTAGQEKFRSLANTYYKASDAVIMVYDVTDPRSFREIQEYWIHEINKHVKDIVFVVVGNKSDLPDKKVDSNLAKNLMVGDNPVMFYEISAKEGTNIEKVFEDISRKFIEMKKAKRKQQRESLGSQVNDQKKQEEIKQSEVQHIARDDGALADNNDIYNLHAHLSEGALKKNDDAPKSECKC